ncbi:hypothetical protein ACIGCZ_38585 [Streptomyces nigra]|uniref:hypothetical protein n=1 Tax=Streptomyces nigra TaxID=1827580 RepID=UPI0037D72A7F
MADISVDTDALALVSPEVAAVARRFQNLASRIDSLVASHGAAYGDDETGIEAKRQNEKVGSDLQEALATLADVLKGTATGVDTMADGLTRTEQLSVDTSTDVNRRMRRA